MTPEQWDSFFKAGHPAKRIRHMVMLEARKHLMNIAPGVTISTTGLGEWLYPEARALLSDEAFDNRKKIFQILQQLAVDGLDDCCAKGDVDGKFMGKPKRPWLWFCPAETEVCAQCGQPLPPVE